MIGPTQKYCIVILGMHRSGTSALSGVLRLLGVHLGQSLLQPAEDNPKGFFENERVTVFNESELLPALKSAWDSVLPLPELWHEAPELDPLYARARDIVLTEYAEGINLFSIKDPRVCILLPFWRKVLESLGIKLLCILPFRNPMEIARSLQRRDRFSIEKSLLLWARHMLAALHYSKDLPRVHISFDGLLDNPQGTIQRIETVLGLKFPVAYDDIQPKLMDFLDQGLKHHKTGLSLLPSDLPDYILGTAHELSECAMRGYDTPESTAMFEELRAGFFGAQRLHYNEDILRVLRGNLDKNAIFESLDETRERIAQLYIDTGAGFNEEHSITLAITDTSVELKFDLSDFTRIEHLRLDPVNCSSVVRISDIGVQLSDGTTQSLRITLSNAANTDGDVYYFESSDPQLYLFTDTSMDGALFVRGNIEVLAVGREAVLQSANIHRKNLKLLKKAMDASGISTALPQ